MSQVIAAMCTHVWASVLQHWALWIYLHYIYILVLYTFICIIRFVRLVYLKIRVWQVTLHIVANACSKSIFRYTKMELKNFRLTMICRMSLDVRYLCDIYALGRIMQMILQDILRSLEKNPSNDTIILALKHIGNATSEAPVKFQNDRSISTTNLAASRLHNLTIEYFPRYRAGPWITPGLASRAHGQQRRDFMVS